MKKRIEVIRLTDVSIIKMFLQWPLLLANLDQALFREGKVEEKMHGLCLQ